MRRAKPVDAQRIDPPGENARVELAGLLCAPAFETLEAIRNRARRCSAIFSGVTPAGGRRLPEAWQAVVEATSGRTLATAVRYKARKQL